MTLVPLASWLRKSSTFETVRLKATTVKPWSFMLRMRFWPMTARPMTAISPLGSIAFNSVSTFRKSRDDSGQPLARQKKFRRSAALRSSLHAAKQDAAGIEVDGRPAVFGHEVRRPGQTELLR